MRRFGDYTEEGAVGYFKRQTPLGLAVKVGGVFVAVALTLGCVGFFAGWFRTAADVVGPENVKAQFQFAYDYVESMDAIGSQWCTAKAAEDASVTPDERLQRSSQRIAIEQNYARVAAQYNARMEDAFRARLVKPPDVPDRAPTLVQTTIALGCG